MKRNIILIGLPASGKTTVGQALAKEWKTLFYDTDYLIEKKYNKKCAEIYKEVGGERFRAYEMEILKDLPLDMPSVISIGGGLPQIEGVLPILKQLGLCLYLREEINTVIQRRANKPLPSFADDWEHYKEAILQRLPYYEAVADVIVECRGRPPQLIVDEILALI